MIWLFCKKKTKHKLLTCVFQHKKSSSSVFMERMKRLKRKRRGARRAERDTKEKERDGLDSAPHPPKNTQSVWLAAQSPGSKVRGKVSFVPSIALVRKDTYAHSYSHINKCLPTCTCIHAHSLVSALRWLWPLFLCSANQKTVLNPLCVSQRRGAAVEH